MYILMIDGMITILDGASPAVLRALDYKNIQEYRYNIKTTEGLMRDNRLDGR